MQDEKKVSLKNVPTGVLMSQKWKKLSKTFLIKPLNKYCTAKCCTEFLHFVTLYHWVIPFTWAKWLLGHMNIKGNIYDHEMTIFLNIRLRHIYNRDTFYKYLIPLFHFDCWRKRKCFPFWKWWLNSQNMQSTGCEPIRLICEQH